MVISRYSRPDLIALWSDERRLATWLEVELCACAAMELAPQSPVPAGTAAALRRLAAESGPPDPARVREIEARTQHDVIAFLTHMEERLGPRARFLHLGMTSSDVLDTALGILLRDACDLILEGLTGRLLPALRAQAEAHRHTPMIGRTHGVHAEPTTAGLVFLSSWAELRRAAERLRAARERVAVGKIAGAVGVYGSGNLSPEVERRALSSLGLSPETVATQIVARDRHAELTQALSLVAAAIERLSTNIRHMQRTEVGELEEPFGKGQKGSSAMPHKKNPILAENLCGLSRLVRAEGGAALENIALWHERDISHSSVERMMLPDVTTLTDFMVHRAAGLVAGLSVRADRMRQNLDRSYDLSASERVMLALIQAEAHLPEGLSRQSAYEIVQRSALQGAAGFRERLAQDPDISRRLDPAQLAACFDLEHHLRHVDAIFARALRPWEAQLASLQPLQQTDLRLPGCTDRHRGKVRDSYLLSDGRRLLVATDRLSAFDQLLGLIPAKGQVLSQLSAYWFAQAERAGIPSHFIALADPNVTVARQCRPLPIEFVVRAYLTGVTSTSIWHAYNSGRREFCGHPLPDGLVKNQALPAPLLTPSTKAESGHDESISAAELLRRGLIDESTLQRASDLCLRLFALGQRLCRERGLILADTKYELGLLPDGDLVFIDEIHTPDSSRFFHLSDYEARLAKGQEPRSLDKEFIRRHLADSGYRGDGPPPPVPDEVRLEAASRYIQAYEQITGQPFVPDLEPPQSRIQRNLEAYLR